MKHLLLILLMTTQVFGNEVVPIKKGEVSPIEGFVIDAEKAQRFRTLGLDYDFKTKEAVYYKQESELLNKRLDLAQQHIDKLSKEVVEEKDDFFTKAGFFLLGAAVTTGIAFGVARAVR